MLILENKVIIKNYKKLAKTDIRKLVLDMINSGLDSIDTKKVVREAIKINGENIIIGNEKISLKDIDRLFIVGIGKCSISASGELERILGDKITDGIAVDVREEKLKKIRTIKGAHPLPTGKNIKATKEIINLLNDTKERDLVIFIVSGGGSTLLCQPKSSKCLDEIKILKCLFNLGADIKKINTVRKHLSSARGGFLAKYAYPSRVVSLIFSDVPGDDLEFIASGPTVKDTTTVSDAEKILKELDIYKKSGLEKIELIETPKNNKYFKNVKNILVVSNKIALNAMAEYAKNKGFESNIKTVELSGEARDVAKKIADELHSKKNGTVLLYGGETTVTVEHEGKGGRNLELTLAATNFIKDDELISSIASDGRDNTDFAGALCDNITKENAEKKNINIKEYLEKNKSYKFFQETGDYILTEDTGRNVSDFMIGIKYGEE